VSDEKIDTDQLIAQKDLQIERYSNSINETNTRLIETRQKLGLPPYEGVPPSVRSSQEQIDRLQSEKWELSPEKRWLEEEIGKDFKVGDEVIYGGEIFRVQHVGAKPSIRKETDWRKDPEGKVDKEVKQSGLLTIGRINGQFRESIGVDWSAVEKATPEMKKNIESMRKDLNL
jgi:hypothetical protein